MFGLVVGPWLLLLALTGSAIAFYDEIDTWLNPGLRTVASATTLAPLDSVVERAGIVVPGFAPSQIDLPDAPGRSIWMIGRASGLAGEPRTVEVFANPHSGAVLGWRETGTFAFDRLHLADTLYGLHVDLLLGPVAAWLVGLVGLLWVVDHAISLGLSIPRLVRWREAFLVGGERGSLRRLFDGHRAAGMWLFPLTLVLAVTGLVLAWPDLSRQAIRPFASVGDRLHDTWPDLPPPDRTIPLEEAMSRVAPRAQIDSVRPLSDHAAYAVRTFDRRDIDGQGRMWTYVSMVDGRILGRRHDNGKTGGDAFFAWQYPLHSGRAFGLPGRVGVAALGLATAFAVISGALLWRRRVRARPARRKATGD